MFYKAVTNTDTQQKKKSSAKTYYFSAQLWITQEMNTLN